MKEFVPYDIALAMKELGFDNVFCLAVYYGDIDDELSSWGISQLDDNENFKLTHYEQQYYAQKGFKNGILAPLYQQAFRWFYENYRGEVSVMHDMTLHDLLSDRTDKDACLGKLIEIVKEKRDGNT